MASTPISPVPAGTEMFSKGVPRPLFHSHAQAQRPLSHATEISIYETEFEDDFSETDSDSPRVSLDSTKKSETSASSLDGPPTPESNKYSGFNFETQELKPVEGPRGPHLFRASVDSHFETPMYMTMSPVVPKEMQVTSDNAYAGSRPDIAPHGRRLSSLNHAVSQLDTREVYNWTPKEVAAWMYASGFDETVVDKFESNDISGAILVDLQFEDLKELDIQSFGKRHLLWNKIHNLRGEANTDECVTSPTVVAGDLERLTSPSRNRHEDCESDEERQPSPPKRRRTKKNRRPSPDDVISPAESVSIVAIEQLLPKPHKCSKGADCPKFRKQQRQLQRLREEHPTERISPVGGGQIFIAGDISAALSPRSREQEQDYFRPTSEAMPSVVASSDVLGPGQYPAFALQEDNLRGVISRDPQENVKQFLNFQIYNPVEEPPSPPLEMFPNLQQQHSFTPHEQLKTLPKLTIPRSASANPHYQDRTATATPTNIYRFGTPASEMDVPVTAIPIGPVTRDFSQSVPPDMRYRQDLHQSQSQLQQQSHNSRPISRSNASRRPSYALAPLDEQPALESAEDYEHEMPHHDFTSTDSRPKDCDYAGWMKKRKTKLLRYEWQEHHFRLNGTQLAMHKDAEATSRALESIDVDDYAIACSSLGGTNKLGAAFKSMKLSGKKRDGDGTAFAFQLVPAIERKGAKGAATGKTHHFAVKDRDERIEWMRELMLAKALKQKGEGYEIKVNGKEI